MMSLDDDIAAWAATVRLPDADADAIFGRIVSTPARHEAVPHELVRAAPARPATVTPGLAPSWWRSYNAGYAARMVASMVRAA